MYAISFSRKDVRPPPSVSLALICSYPFRKYTLLEREQRKDRLHGLRYLPNYVGCHSQQKFTNKCVSDDHYVLPFQAIPQHTISPPQHMTRRFPRCPTLHQYTE